MAYEYKTRGTTKYRVGDTVLLSCEYADNNPRKDLPSSVQVTIDYVDTFGDYDGTCTDCYSIYMWHRFHFVDKDVIELIRREDKRSDSQIMIQNISDGMTEVKETVKNIEDMIRALEMKLKILSDLEKKRSKNESK